MRLSRPIDRYGLPLLSAVSGMGGLAYQVLYLRHLTTYFGDMFYIHLTVMGLFILGFGTGAKYARYLTSRLAAVEILIGSYAILLPTLVSAFQASPLAALFSSPVTQAIFSVLILLAVPSFCIGVSIPLFSLYLQSGGEKHAFNRIYFLYNVGSAVSLLLVEFFLIRNLGIRHSLAAVGMANLACGVILFWRRRQWIPSAEAKTESYGPPELAQTIALFLASAAAAIFQSQYIKLYYRLFKAMRENFAICTASSVLCIAVGTWMVRRYRLKLSTCLLGAGACYTVIYLSYGPISIACAYVLVHATGIWSQFATKAIFSVLLCLPYVFLGATIPALLVDEREIARRSGDFLFTSGLGNAIGLILFCFILHPHVEFFRIAWVFFGLITMAAVITEREWLKFRRGNWAPAVIGLMVVGTVLFPTFSDALAYIPLDFPIAQIEKDKHFKSGPDTVSFFEWNDYTWITYNDQLSITIKGPDGLVNWDETLSGIIPALVAPRRERAMVLGLGSGITGGTVATLFEHTDIVEINRAFFDFARFNAENNSEVMTNPRATVIHDDARRFLARAEGKYDEIVNSIPTPEFFSASKIYTHEFYELVKRALKDDGVFSLWFTPEETTPAGISILLQTLAQTFAQCNLVTLTAGYYFASCVKEGASLRYRSRELPENSRLADYFRKYRIHSKIQPYLDALLLTDNIFTPEIKAGKEINYDDFPILEFVISRNRYLQQPTFDPVIRTPGALNISVASPKDTADFITKAVVLAQVHPRFFQKFYAPVLDANADLRREYFLLVKRIKSELSSPQFSMLWQGEK